MSVSLCIIGREKPQTARNVTSMGMGDSKCCKEMLLKVAVLEAVCARLNDTMGRKAPGWALVG